MNREETIILGLKAVLPKGFILADERPNLPQVSISTGRVYLAVIDLMKPKLEVVFLGGAIKYYTQQCVELMNALDGMEIGYDKKLLERCLYTQGKF